MKHELKRVDEERDSDGHTRWRWVCSCHDFSRGGLGRWNYQSDNVARHAWQQHALRSRAPVSHRVFVEEVETNRAVLYRWECSCRRHGSPVAAKWYAEQLGEKHRICATR